MGRPARKLSPEPEPEPNIVQAKTQITYVAPYAVPPATSIEIETEADGSDDDDEEFIFEEPEPPAARKTIKERLIDAGVVPTEAYSMTIEKFAANIVASGPKSTKTACTRIFLTEDDLLSKVWVSTVERYGPGRYWLSIYGRTNGPNVGLISGFEYVVDAPLGSEPPVVAVLPAASSPDELDKLFTLMERIEKMRRRDAPAALVAAPAALDNKAAVASFLMEDPSLAKKVVANLIGGQTESESTLGLIIQNAEPIGKAIEGIVVTIFSHLQALKGEQTPSQQPNFQPGFFNPVAAQTRNQPTLLGNVRSDPEKQFAEFLMAWLNSPELSGLDPAHAASQIIIFSDAVDDAGRPAISHYIEAIARQDALQAIPMIEALSGQKFTNPPALRWFKQFQAELPQYFEEVPPVTPITEDPKNEQASSGE